MDYQAILDSIKNDVVESPDKGKVASYIPELGKVDGKKFGISLIDISGNSYGTGDYNELFSIQSISKVFALLKAFQLIGVELWQRVGVEPSGDPFNQLSLLELENGIPRNPCINPGAIVVCDVLVSALSNPKEELLHLIRDLAKDETIDFDLKVAQSEKDTGFGNYAAANLIKSFGNLTNDVDTVLDLYFHLCSIEMNCSQLAMAFFPFFNDGKCSEGNFYLDSRRVKRINAIMQTCGFYDQAGEFAFEVGLPGKSGVGGGIVAILPGEFSVAAWSPGLNIKGNSTLGMLALEKLTTKIGHSIF